MRGRPRGALVCQDQCRRYAGTEFGTLHFTNIFMRQVQVLLCSAPAVVLLLSNAELPPCCSVSVGVVSTSHACSCRACKCLIRYATAVDAAPVVLLTNVVETANGVLCRDTVVHAVLKLQLRSEACTQPRKPHSPPCHLLTACFPYFLFLP